MARIINIIGISNCEFSLQSFVVPEVTTTEAGRVIILAEEGAVPPRLMVSHGGGVSVVSRWCLSFHGRSADSSVSV